MSIVLKSATNPKNLFNAILPPRDYSVLGCGEISLRAWPGATKAQGLSSPSMYLAPSKSFKGGERWQYIFRFPTYFPNAL